MITFPNAKINLGLRVIRKRNDGFHDIETVFFPIGLCDVLEVLKTENNETIFKCTGISIDPSHSEAKKNLVVRMYELLKKDFHLPPVYIHLHKAIPVGAGLGGGSADCAFMLKILNDLFRLGLNPEQQHDYVTRLGSDCAFFLENKPVLATGRGDMMQPVHLNLSGYHILVVKPKIHIETSQAYSWVKPFEPKESLAEIIQLPPTDWKNFLFNDFEGPVFTRYPVISEIKKELYNAGAVHAAMTGSGSAVYGIFTKEPEYLRFNKDIFQWRGLL